MQVTTTLALPVVVQPAITVKLPLVNLLHTLQPVQLAKPAINLLLVLKALHLTMLVLQQAVLVVIMERPLLGKRQARTYLH